MSASIEDPTRTFVPFCGCYAILDRHNYYVYREVCSTHRESSKTDVIACAHCHTPMLIPRSLPLEEAARKHAERCLGVCYRRYYEEYCPYDNYAGRR